VEARARERVEALDVGHRRAVEHPDRAHERVDLDLRLALSLSDADEPGAARLVERG